MLKRKNKMLVGILALFLVMTVGYAIFTQTLNINGTASAQGNFDLTYECGDVENQGDGTGTCMIEEDKSITTTSTLTKPNDYMIYNIRITNSGTIPVILKMVDSPNNVNEVDGVLEENGDQGYIDMTTLLTGTYDIFYRGNYYQSDSIIESLNITLEPDEYIEIEVVHGWANSSYLGMNQPELPEGGATIEYNLKFGFEQVTA